MIAAVVFDMDGVLIEARDWHFEALNRALELFGAHISADEHRTTFDGLPTADKLEILSEVRGLPRGLHAFINELKQHYTMQIIATRCRPRFIHEHALAQLAAEGYRLAVASNSIAPTIEAMLTRAHLLHRFDVVVSASDVSRGKPDPQIYTTTFERLGLRADECLVVEDNHHGIASARAAGAHLLEVAGPDDVHYSAIRSRLDELADQPDRVHA